jgi:hypothetical protein
MSKLNNVNCRVKIFFVFLLFTHVTLLHTGIAGGTEISIPSLKGKTGKTIEVPLVIDEASNLAGIKLIINYDKGLLTFKEGNKTKSTQPMMHIINDKKPGRLVIVMAGAKGISGKDLALMTLTFEIKAGLKGNHTTQFEIVEAQLMSDQLKDIKCRITVKALNILP